MYVTINIGLIVICIIYMYIDPHIMEYQRKYIQGSIVLIAAIVYALRPLDTKDTAGYVNGFFKFENYSLVHLSLLQKYEGYEVGYIAIVKLFREYSDNYRLFFFAISLIGLSLAVYSLNRYASFYYKKEKAMVKQGLSGTVLAAYVAMYGFLYHGISVRAGLSLGLALYASVLLLDNKYIRAVLFVILAFSIQRTTALVLVAYCIYRYMPVFSRGAHALFWSIGGALMLTGCTTWLLNTIVRLLISLMEQYQVSGYTAYMTSLDPDVGITDIYKWLLYGLMILLANEKDIMKRLLNVVMIGAMIVVFMHDIRSVSRAYDLFYVFSIPILADFAVSGTACLDVMNRIKKPIGLIVIVAGGVLMLKTSFF